MNVTRPRDLTDNSNLGAATMSRSELDTSPTLLKRAADWSDRTAWNRMHDRYDALLDRWSRRALDNPTDVGEFKQILWIEIARRLVGFRYDPNRSFRSWLKTLHTSRVSDFRKSRARAARRSEGYREFACTRIRHDVIEPPIVDDCPTSTDTNATEAQPARTAMHARLERAQAIVQARFTQRSWAVFWSISMENRSIRETAAEFGMTYAAAFAAYSRVRDALKLELERTVSP